MDPTLKRAYARLLSLGYPKEPLSKVKFHSLAYARLAELPSFLLYRQAKFGLPLPSSIR